MDKLIQTNVFDENYPLPLVINPIPEDLSLINWATNNKSLIDKFLLKHGGILFRGFNNFSSEDLQNFISEVSGETLEYNERSSPRTQVKGNIYTSTEYPPTKDIPLHNENSYQKSFPARIFFFCETPSESGGETPIADCRRVLSNLETSLIEEFKSRKWSLVRNFNRGFGLTWQNVFQTNDKSKVEDYCRQNDVGFVWEENDILQTTARREAIHHHPETNEAIWFNHGVFFHISSIEKGMRFALQEVFDDNQLPSNTFWGDGQPFDDKTINLIRQAYANETVSFKWQKNDLLMLDNMLVAHGRSTFTGDRRILVGMSNLISSDKT